MNDSAARSQGRIIRSAFAPHPWLRGPHLQTIAPTLFRPSPPLQLDIETLELPDGDYVRIGWAGIERAGQRVAVLVHGLTGGFISKYLRGLATLLLARGWRVAILELRGAGDEPNRLPRNYHHGDTGDLRYLWRLLKTRDPQARLVGVGWSLGANVLLKALAEEGERAPLVAAAAASAPFGLEACAEKLRSGFARVYQAHLLRALKQMIARKHAQVPLPAGIDIAAAFKARDFFAFDDAYTAPLHGFTDARDYYRRSACGGYLQQIARPTLIVNAIDDPFMQRSILPSEAMLSPDVTLELSKRGGHVGFIAADARGRLDYWLERRLATWLDETVPA